MEKRAQIDHQLLLAQAGWVRGLAGTLVRDPLGAEDVAQETLLAALAAPPLRMDDERSLRAWLARVVTNLARLAARGNVRRHQREQIAAQPDVVASVSETVERASQLRHVVDTVLTLDEPYRSTVLLRFFEGLDSAEIGRRTGATPVAVRKRLSRGLDRLRKQLDDDYAGDREAWHAALLPLALDGLGSGLAAPGPAPLELAGWTQGGLQAAAGMAAALALAGLSVLVVTSQRGPEGSEPASPGPEVGYLVRPAGTEELARRVAVLDPEPQAARIARRKDLRVPPPPPPIESGADAPRAPDAQAPAEARSLSGLLVALDGLGLGGVRIVDRAAPEPLAVTAPDGSFEIDPDRVADLMGSRLGAAAEDLATVRSAAVDAAGLDRGVVIVAAPSIDLGGWVLDAAGRAVSGARVRLEVPDAAFVDLWLALDGTRAVGHETRSDGDGRFELPAIPTHPEFRLVASAEGHGEVRLPLPSWSDSDWSIALPGAGAEGVWVAGRVLMPDGSPAAGAHVRVGPRSARTDRRGRYNVPVDGSHPTPLVVAELDGWRPVWDTVSVGDPGTGGGGGANVHTLQIEGELLSIPGVALGPQGLPAGGWVVVALDDETDPSQPNRPRGGVAGRTVSASDGSFLLEGLLDRNYRILAVDQATGAQAGPETVPAGGAPTVVATRTAVEGAPREGRVESPSGHGLSGAVVTPVLAAADGFVALGPAVTTAANGRFSLPGVAGAGGGAQALVLVQHATALAPSLGPLGYLEVPADAWFMFTGGSYEPPPDALEVLDGAGLVVTMHLPTGSTERLRLTRLRSPVVRVPETARTLVLYHRGREIERLAMHLVPGALTAVQSWRRDLGSAAVRAAKVRPGGLGGAPPGGASGLSGPGSQNPEKSVTQASARQP